jgi:1-acyl-sn-glycerol-3-phosphate acyltransferase
MKIFIRLVQYIYCGYAILLFCCFLLLMLPVVLVSFLLGKIRGGNLIMYFARRWADVWLFLIGINHQRIIEQPLRKGVSYIFISNHNSYMDIPQILKAIQVPFRALGKAEAGNIPVFGWVYNEVVITVLRSSAEERARSLQNLREVLSRGISIYIAPEGTFNMGDAPLIPFFDGAFRLAIETQTPVKPMLFLDALDRMHWRSLLTLNPGKLRTVYLEEVSPEGYTIEDLPLFKEKVYRLMEEKLLAYGASWIKQ